MSGSTFRMGEGDWICSDPHCANINFARRTQCNRCGSEKSESLNKRKLGQEIGKAAAAKSHGLFSADDWQCNKCGNVNWARRQQCNVCNAPRFGDVEERTGLGGGYNDRGVVEYKQRNDSDDEYDEFGRRRKKLKKSDAATEGECRSSNGRRSPVTRREDKRGKDRKEGDGREEEDEDGDEDRVGSGGGGGGGGGSGGGCNTKEDDEDADGDEEEEEDDEDEEDDDGDLSKYDLSDWAVEKS